MHLGSVCLFLALFAGIPLRAQVWGGGSQFRPSANRAVIRADGTAVDGDFSRRRAAARAGAISFRHYIHEPPKQARQYFQKAIKAVDSHNDQEAISQLVEATRADPDYFEAHAQLGLLYLKSEKYGEALPHLERALAIDASSQVAQVLAAGALLGVGKFADAERAAKRAIQLGSPLPVLDDVIRLAQLNRAAIARNASADSRPR